MFTIWFKNLEGCNAGSNVIWYDTLDEAKKELSRNLNILINENLCDLADELCILDESGRIML